MRRRLAMTAVASVALICGAAGCILFGDAPDPPSAAGPGGGGGGEPVTCVEQWDPCESDADCCPETGRCILAAVPACSGAACAPEPRCAPPLDGIADFFACSADDECASRSCVGGGGCRRFCVAASDCPAGFHCAELLLENGEPIAACAGDRPGTDSDPQQTLCDLEAGLACPEGRHCALRLHIPEGGVEADRSSAVCALDEEGQLDTLAICPGDRQEGGCRGGWCRACTQNLACGRGYRCTAPCLATDDCPFPESCVPALASDFGTLAQPGLKYCSLGSACLDQEDCPDVGSECRVQLQGSAGSLVASCTQREAPRQPLGSACGGDDDCGSGLCLALQGPGICTSPCRPAVPGEAGSICGDPPLQSPDCTCSTPGLPGRTCSLLRGGPAQRPDRAIYACQP